MLLKEAIEERQETDAKAIQAWHDSNESPTSI